MAQQLTNTEALDRDTVMAQIRLVMSKAFGVPAQTIQEETTPADVSRWDSLAMVTVMIGLERRLGRKIPFEIGVSAGSVSTLADRICALN